MKAKIFEILEGTSENKKLANAFSFFIMTLISLNAVAIVLETVGTISSRFDSELYAFEAFSVAVFTVEYLLRIWGCTVDNRYSRPFWGRVRFALTPMAMIDLLAFLPFYLAFIVTDLRFLRILRLMRIFRLIKLVRYSKAIHTFGIVIKAKKEEMIVIGALGAILMFMASSFMYFAEREAQPEAFNSIPHAMWWAVATLTTVGYGDITPITTAGKFLAGIIAILGIGMFALPAGILGSAFVEEFETRRGKFLTCPHCREIISNRRKDDSRRSERKGTKADRK